MKRLIPAAILFVIVIISYFGSLNYINGVCDEAKEQVSRCETEYRSGGNARRKGKEICKSCGMKRKAISHFSSITAKLTRLNWSLPHFRFS